MKTLGSCPASGAPWSSAMPPSLGRGRVNNNKGLSEVIVRVMIVSIAWPRRKFEWDQSYQKNFWCKLVYTKNLCCRHSFSQLRRM